MYEKIEYWMTAMSAAFLADDDDGIASLCASNMPIYLENDLIAAATPQDVVEILRAIRGTYRAEGLRDMHGEILSTGVPCEGRFMARITWHYTMASGFNDRAATLIYYFCEREPTASNNNDFLLEMIEYQKEAFPMEQLAAVIPQYFRKRTNGP